MSELTRIPGPDGVFPAAQYSHVVMGTGRLVAVAGQIAVDGDGKLVGKGDPGAQPARSSRTSAAVWPPPAPPSTTSSNSPTS